MSSNPPQAKAGYRPAEWAPLVGISRTAFYDLPKHMQPRAVHIGKAHVVIEQPHEYLERIAKQQIAEAPK